MGPRIHMRENIHVKLRIAFPMELNGKSSVLFIYLAYLAFQKIDGVIICY